MNHTHIEWWKPEPVHGDVHGDWWMEGRAGSGGWVPPVSAIPFWAAILFTFVLLFSPQAYFPGLAVFRPALLVIGTGIVFYLSDRWVHQQPLILWTREAWLAMGLFIWAAATVPFSIWPGGSASMLFDQFFKTLTMFWLLAHVVSSTNRLYQIAAALTVMGVGLSGFAIYNYASGAFIANDGVERLVGNEGGLTKNPNDMALMINLIMPLTISLFLSSKTIARRAVLLGAIVCELATVVMTYSRAGALTIGIIFVLYMWKLRRRRERSWLFAVAAVGILSLPMVPSSYYERLSTISSIESDQTGSSQERWSDMTIALKSILSNPIKGHGVGMNVNTMRDARGQEGRAVHNVYLEHALDLGLPGLMLFLLLVASCVKAARVAQERSMMKGKDTLFHLAQGIEISLIAYLVEGMFHPVSFQFYFYYIASLAVAVRRLALSEESYA